MESFLWQLQLTFCIIHQLYKLEVYWLSRPCSQITRRNRKQSTDKCVVARRSEWPAVVGDMREAGRQNVAKSFCYNKQAITINFGLVLRTLSMIARLNGPDFVIQKNTSRCSLRWSPLFFFYVARRCTTCFQVFVWVDYHWKQSI